MWNILLTILVILFVLCAGLAVLAFLIVVLAELWKDLFGVEVFRRGRMGEGHPSRDRDGGN